MSSSSRVRVGVRVEQFELEFEVTCSSMQVDPWRISQSSPCFFGYSTGQVFPRVCCPLTLQDCVQMT